MTLNIDDVCRKSSVYNQTGQSYFQQLTAYNHMSAHLRRLVLAPSVIDSRNKKYARERDKHQQRHGSRCSCCFRIRRRNLIEGLAYDTKHHPSDALRMNLKRNSGCRSKDNNRASAPRERTGRGEHTIGNKFDRDAVEYFETPASRSPRSNGEPSRRNSSEGQYESHTDSEFDSPNVNNASVDATGNNKPRANDRLDRHSDEAKYAKFIYDITREIMINGLYTDEELQAIFEKHFRINYDLLDRDKMRSEIDQLRTSLNLTADCSEDEGENNPRIAILEKFATPSASNGSSTRSSKALYRNKLAEKIRDTFEEPERLKNSLGGENAADSKSDLYIAEKDVIVALMEMKLDPQQIQTIRKRLRNKSRETAVPSKTVQVDVKRNYEHKKNERMNSLSTLRRPEWRTSQLFRLSDPQLEDNRRNETSGRAVGRDETSLSKHRHHCQCCRCGQNKQIVDDSETRESISSPNIDRESQKENDKRTKKSSEENFVAKNVKNIDAALNTSAISVISTEKEPSTSSEEKYNAAEENIATSNGEAKPVSAEIATNIERENSFDDLASISECSSQTDEVEIVEELMQISEEEETNDRDDVSVAVDN